MILFPVKILYLATLKKEKYIGIQERLQNEPPPKALKIWKRQYLSNTIVLSSGLE